ncbi:endonuclease domain-containing protein [Microbacterium sp. USHLN186]|uniref:endonuclease domain-containing protein n=1 Tax=Microbacterium sp. USHLN186 TaxID=3081286 RepID=UPI0030196B8D
MIPRPLPSGIPPTFTVREAAALGLSPGRLRAKDLSRPYHGTRARVPLEQREGLQLLLKAVPQHAFLCGITAAAVLGLPLCSADEKDAWGRPRIGVPHDCTRVRRPQLRAHRLIVTKEEIVQVDGFLTLEPARAWVDLSRSQPLGRFVAITDALLRGYPSVSSEHLAGLSRKFRRAKGGRMRTRALELCDARSESPRESMVRVILVEAGLPVPECNVDIFAGDVFVARVDMLFAEAKLIVEYDGDYHRDADQWSRDQIRRAELESLGYRVTVVTRRDFDDPDALVARIRRLLTDPR